jgi:glycosyltransferase involved in cell wall biosynthesis
MWICSQIGAREHYAIPRALIAARREVALCTDFWAGPMLRKLAAGKLRSLAARCHPGLDNAVGFSVRSWNLRALFWEKRLRQMTAAQTPYHGFIEIGRRFAECVREELKSRRPPPGSVFFAYDTGALETMEWCRDQRIKCVLDQMDPNRTEVELVQAEEKNWPGWARQELRVPEEYFVRREQEWTLADRIVVNSEFSRRALIQQGVPAGRLVVMPLCYEAATETTWLPLPEISAAAPLRVLFLGQVILRKGIQYLLSAAKKLEGENIRFDIVGPVGISDEAVSTAPRNVYFHGRTSRDQAAKWYRQAHLFALPTLSDGFAITQLEAMTHGLPVVATDCCGEVVANGKDGFVTPARDVDALARTFQQYLAQPELLASQREAARLKSRQFGLQRLTENLARLEAGLAE